MEVWYWVGGVLASLLLLYLLIALFAPEVLEK